MYVPRFNAEDDPREIHAMMRSHPLAALVTLQPSGLFASHVPLVLHAADEAPAVLRGHLARANTQWRDFNSAVEALAIFTGPQHYVSPSWYPTKSENHRSVPTWNYVAVHASGPLRVIEDAGWLRLHLGSLTQTHESQFETPWTMEDAPADYIEAMIRGIVGIELTVHRLEGKRKLSQNREERDRAGVVAGLDSLDTHESHRLAHEMRAQIRKDKHTA